jgi:hypothetical protein
LHEVVEVDGGYRVYVVELAEMSGMLLLPVYVVPPTTIELPDGSHEKVTTGVVSEDPVCKDVVMVPTAAGLAVTIVHPA